MLRKNPSNPTVNVTADYIVIGAGAVGMAFADTILTETDSTVAIIDKHHKPGGHWNVAYPFVTLHQPSNFYGVSSRELSEGIQDQVGLNKGLGDLASGAEVSAYFDKVMRHQFLPTGRVEYFPMCRFSGFNTGLDADADQIKSTSKSTAKSPNKSPTKSTGQFTNILSGQHYEAHAHKKFVDCTYLKTTVPSTHTPNFDIASGAQFIPLNTLAMLEQTPEGYVIIGGGKTGIDACLFLLENGVNPDAIQWIISRDAWLLNRKNTQPSEAFFESTMGAQAAQFESLAHASSIDDAFSRLESSGYFLRLDKNIRPEMFHGATISELELAQLRRIKNTIRMGRVTAVGTHEIILEKGTIPTSPNHIHVDCSASAISNLEMKPIFEDHLITPQTVRSYQPVFSAAFIAHIEATLETTAEKNALCRVVPLPNKDTDYFIFTAAFMMNQYNWSQNPELKNWLLNNRLDGFSKLVAGIQEDDTEKRAIMKRLRNHAMPAMAKLNQFIAELETQ